MREVVSTIVSGRRRARRGGGQEGKGKGERGRRGRRRERRRANREVGEERGVRAEIDVRGIRVWGAGMDGRNKGKT